MCRRNVHLVAVILPLLFYCTFGTLRIGKSNFSMDHYQPIADQIIDHLTTGPGKGQALDRLSALTDNFGHRMVGEKSLEDAIDYLIGRMAEEGLDNVHKEVVPNLPHWTRGKDTVTMVLPRRQNLATLALGGCVPTPEEGLCGKVIVVKSFEELEKKSDEVRGNIVVYNQEYKGYGSTVPYRTRGATEAAKHGAIAALIRSITPHSLNTPHTGQMAYEQGTPKIPALSLTLEDAQMLQRVQERGQTIKICMNVTSRPVGTVESHNTVAQITGTKYPDEIVLISGHLDSWDVGVGAMDDGGGVIAAWQALSTIKALNLKPKRTIRAVFWTAEEQGYLGCAHYYQNHKSGGIGNEIYRFVYESDAGAFKPDGITFVGPRGSDRWNRMKQILKLLKPINATKLHLLPEGSAAGDVEPWRHNDHVPAAILDTVTKNDYYFTYHHTQADRVEIFSREDLDYVAALTAVISFVVADMDETL